MSEVIPQLNYLEAREIKLPVVPWRRIAKIREYAGSLAIPGLVGGNTLPMTRVGLQRLAHERSLYDARNQLAERSSELAEIMGKDQAFLLATKELFQAPNPDQATLFDKE